MNTQKIIFKNIENKTIIWFQDNNQYIVVEKTVATIMKQLKNNISVSEIAIALSKKINIPKEKAIHFVTDVEQFTNSSSKKKQENSYNPLKHPHIFLPKNTIA